MRLRASPARLPGSYGSHRTYKSHKTHLTMRLRTSHARRRAYTLLEVLLAAAIGVLLLGALYVALDIHMRHAQISRDVVEQSTLARFLLARISSDITPSLGPPEPARFRASSGGGQSGGGGQQGGTPTTAPATGGGTTLATSTSTPAAASSAASASSTPTTSQFTFQVIGDASQLTLFVSRVPRNPKMQAGTDAPPVASDLRRISYWLAGSGGEPLGLARQSITLVTAEDAQAMPQESEDEAKLVIAEEVKSLSFSYWDGTAWQESWDGTATGSDGVSPIGPPLAIAITIGLVTPGSGGAGSEPTLKQYRHVVAIRAANGATQATTGEP